MFFLLLLSAGITILPSCEDGYIYIGDCYSEKPQEAELEVKLTIDDENKAVLITLLRGKLEDADTLYVESVMVESFYYTVPVDNYYTVVATYQSGKKSIKAVDGTRLRVVDNTQEDGSICFQIRGNKLNVSLAY